VVADVAEEDDVARLVDAALGRFPQLDTLVCNAGIYGPIGLLEDGPWEEWEHAVRVNLFGSVLCCRALVPHLRARGYGKIVQVSGGGATAPMPRFSAYAASKAAVIRFAETLAEELRDAGIDVNAIAPGPLNTRLLDDVLSAGPDHAGAEFHARAVEQRESGGVPLELAARLAVFLASAASDGISGRLISARWDAWEGLMGHRDELAASDVYTLRRIVPADRGLDW
jgi:3-oxoacyl-[acyl-carrier protein] reductase